MTQIKPPTNWILIVCLGAKFLVAVGEEIIETLNMDDKKNNKVTS